MGSGNGFLIGSKPIRSEYKGGIEYGTHAFKSLEFVKKYIEILNEQYPGLRHCYKDADAGTPFIDIKDYSLEYLMDENLNDKIRMDWTKH